MELTFLGAAGTVTGSKYLLRRGGHRVLIDCGLFQGYKALRLRNWAPFPVPVRDVDAVVLTHAHIDHSGYLPLFVRSGFQGPVYCTEATYELCRILLPDSGRLQEEEAEYANRRGFSKHHPAQPLYTEADALKALERFEPHPFRSPIEVCPGLSATLIPAGHILGSAMVRVTDGRQSILFSGDLGRPHDDVMRPPEAVPQADWLVVESTYGDRRHEGTDPTEKLAEVIRRTTGHGGVVVIPSFAVGRTQTLLHAIQQLKLRGAIPDSLPVYLNSPMAADVTSLYSRHADEHRLDAETCRAMGRAARIINTVEESRGLNERKGPMVIIAGSGMAAGGRVVHHLKAFAGDPRNTILFVGFQAAGTRGAAIMAGAEAVKIHGEFVPIRAKVESISNLSAHADCAEILDWLGHFESAPQRVFVTHGEPAAADALRQKIQSQLGWSAVVPEHLDRVELEAVARIPAEARLPSHALSIHRFGIDTYQEPVVYMRADCHVCRSEGFNAQSRVKLTLNSHSVIATLNIVRTDLLGESQAGLSEAAWLALGGQEGDAVRVSHPDPLESFSAVRAKVYGEALGAAQIESVVRDVAAGRYSALELAAFVTVCGGDNLGSAETVALTRAMVEVGERIQWPKPLIVDKHCVGGLPGNRTTPIVVAIAAACGLIIPKTSSRAITSPAGTADTMEMLAPVALDLPTMRRVVEKEGGCVVWGGAMALSPADDVLIRIERPLDFDSQGQLAASILSKKIAAGSTHLLIDVPVGPTAKIRTAEAALRLRTRLQETGEALGVQIQIIETDGTRPVGRGIGPALEARDVLAVLQNTPEAPADLRERALLLAAHLLELGGAAPSGGGAERARGTLASGAAWRKFEAICAAQGGMRTPPMATYRQIFKARKGGVLMAIDNRRLARIAKLAGAPKSPAAGLELQCSVGQSVAREQPLFTLHAESPGELAYAAAYADAHADTFQIGEAA